MDEFNEPANAATEHLFIRTKGQLTHRHKFHTGMSIRQAFVMAAMQGLSVVESMTTEMIAKYAIEIADACLKREKETRNQ